MNPHHEHEFEAAPGLPEALPKGETLIWQGVPKASLLAIHVFHLRKLVFYFAFMLLLQALYLAGDPEANIARAVTISAVMAGLCLLCLRGVAWYAARNTRYTLTSRRVVMRIGMVLTITLNIPLKQIRAASVRGMKGGAGDIALGLIGKDQLGWLHLWPHVRAWTFRKPEPCLRCIDDVQQVSALFLAAWQKENPQVTVSLGDSAPASQAPALQGATTMQMS